MRVTGAMRQAANASARVSAKSNECAMRQPICVHENGAGRRNGDDLRRAIIYSSDAMRATKRVRAQSRARDADAQAGDAGARPADADDAVQARRPAMRAGPARARRPTSGRPTTRVRRRAPPGGVQARRRRLVAMTGEVVSQEADPGSRRLLTPSPPAIIYGNAAAINGEWRHCEINSCYGDKR